MKGRLSFLKIVVHIGCCAALICLIWDVFQVRCRLARNEALAIEIARNARMATAVAGEVNSRALDWAKQEVEDYPVEESVLYYNKMLQARQLADIVDANLVRIREEKSDLENSCAVIPTDFWDSLLNICEYDKETLLYFDHNIWPEKRRWQETLHNASSADERNAFIQAMEFRNMLALAAVYDLFRKKIGGTSLRFDPLYPVFITDPIFPLAGQTFKGELFLRDSRTTNRRDTRFWVNNQEIFQPFSLTKTFARPGPQRFRVSAEVRNPLTQHLETCERDYILNVDSGDE